MTWTWFFLHFYKTTKFGLLLSLLLFPFTLTNFDKLSERQGLAAIDDKYLSIKRDLLNCLVRAMDMENEKLKDGREIAQKAYDHYFCRFSDFSCKLKKIVHEISTLWIKTTKNIRRKH
jgi:leucyl-tRNA synthetase